jgi:hypothetical protein
MYYEAVTIVIAALTAEVSWMVGSWFGYRSARKQFQPQIDNWHGRYIKEIERQTSEMKRNTEARRASTESFGRLGDILAHYPVGPGDGT